MYKSDMIQLCAFILFLCFHCSIFLRIFIRQSFAVSFLDYKSVTDFMVELGIQSPY